MKEYAQGGNTPKQHRRISDDTEDRNKMYKKICRYEALQKNDRTRDVKKGTFKRRTRENKNRKEDCRLMWTVQCSENTKRLETRANRAEQRHDIGPGRYCFTALNTPR